MCGFAGWVVPEGAPIDERMITSMVRALAHRGPDGEKLHFEAGCGLGHRRLALIDVEGGGQPITNESGEIRIVANNEIYNYVELRRELQSRGHELRTDGDTEVIVHLYEDFGEDCLERLIGMYAFALWDRRSRSLLLARDRFGIKPLYYFADDRGGLRFASELRALLAVPGVDRSLDPTAIRQYLRDLTIPEPQTVFRRVRKLPAGHCLLWREGTVRTRRYWTLPEHSEGGFTREVELQEALEAALLQSTQWTLRSDEPLGLFLSGGLDSSLLAWAMRQCGARPLRTFSASFDEAPFDESAHSHRVAMAFEAQHTEIRVTREEAADTALDLTAWFDEPFADSSAIPTYLLSRRARQQVKGVLSGEGADELFAGSLWHSAARPRGSDAENLVAPPAKVLFSEETLDGLIHGDARTAVDDVPDVVAEMPAGLDPLHRRLYVDLHLYLPSDLLTKIDRMSMLSSLEVRVPYLNHPFAELAWSVPSSMKWNGRSRKVLLRRLARRHLPEGIAARPKQGFAVPMDVWLWQEGRLRDAVYDTLRDSRCRCRGWFHMPVVEQMLEDHHRARRMYGHGLWALFVLERWLQRNGNTEPQIRVGGAQRS